MTLKSPPWLEGKVAPSDQRRLLDWVELLFTLQRRPTNPTGHPRPDLSPFRP
ncbi:MAG: hypothetical protein H9917_04725 [Candidatus Oceanisphaera merdipullorum]|nr:hypothetical protein [Candidatus Oceanisphaera merdipullorum]